MLQPTSTFEPDDGPPPAHEASAEGVAIARGPFATIAELCAAVDRKVVPLLRQRFGEDAFPDATRCRPTDPSGLGLAPATLKDRPFEDAAFIEVDDLEQDHTSLAVKTRVGWFRTDVHLRSHDHMDTTCMSAVRARLEDVRIVETRTGERVAMLRTVERETRWGSTDAGENASVWTESAWACGVDTGDIPRCEGPKVLATTTAANPADFDADEERFLALDLTAIPWHARKASVLGASGDLRAE